jgi:hypothetical protein
LIAQTTNDAPLIISPAAKTPDMFVSLVSKSAFIVPPFVTCNFSSSNNLGSSSGSNPNAFIIISALISNSEFFCISGFLLPLSSGSPGLILSAVELSTLSEPLKTFGLLNQIISIP